MTWEVLQGDCRKRMASLEDNSIDAIVCDPPYELGFMGKAWDKSDIAYDPVVWGEAFRVLKPGGHVAAFGGTRTYHRLAVAIEDAGFEIRDSIGWNHPEQIFCQCDAPGGPLSEEAEHHLPDVPDQDVQTPVGTQSGQREILLEGVQEPGPPVASQASGNGDAGLKQPSMEGGRDLPPTEGQLRAGPLRPSAGVGATDGSQGRLHHGASASHGDGRRATPSEDRSGPPPGPRSAEQSPEQPGALAFQWIPQGGGAWPGCPRCGKPLAPPTFSGPLAWQYGQGFPKSRDISKEIDKAAGAERQVIGERKATGNARRTADGKAMGAATARDAAPADRVETFVQLTEPATEDAQRWAGWGTALKPSWEPIVLARKPFAATVMANVLEHGTGAINVDGCRIAMSDEDRTAIEHMGGYGTPGWERQEAGVALAGSVDGSLDRKDQAMAHEAGRWPANALLTHHPQCEAAGTRQVRTGTAGAQSSYGWGTEYVGGELSDQKKGFASTYADEGNLETIEAWDCHPECPVRLLDEQSGENQSGVNITRRVDQGGFMNPTETTQGVGYGDLGGASRFFYTSKATRAERNAGVDQPAIAAKRTHNGGEDTRGHPIPVNRNDHPTVKPIDLMRWLVRLITPPGGRVLDPFAGSGSTGCAAVLEGFDFTGMELGEKHARTARERIGFWAEHPTGLPIERALAAEKARRDHSDAGQASLFDAPGDTPPDERGSLTGDRTVTMTTTTKE